MKIRIYNCLTKKGDCYYLNSGELYFYSFLQTKYLSFMGYCESTLNIISETQLMFDDQNENRKIEKVKNVIFMLEEKGLIKIEYEGVFNKNSTIRITFTDVDDGFELIDNEMFFSISDYRQLYVLLLIKKNKGVYEKAKDKWSDVLGYGSKNTGVEIVERMEREGIIHCIGTGRFVDDQRKIKQATPKWYLGEKQETVVKDKRKGKPKRNDEDIIIAASFENTVKDVRSLIEESNWGKRDDGGGLKKLTYADYEIYRVSLDENIDTSFNKRCKNVINKIKQSENYDGYFEEWEGQYLREKIETMDDPVGDDL
jgi:hypothetical protein